MKKWSDRRPDFLEWFNIPSKTSLLSVNFRLTQWKVCLIRERMQERCQNYIYSKWIRFTNRLLNILQFKLLSSLNLIMNVLMISISSLVACVALAFPPIWGAKKDRRTGFSVFCPRKRCGENLHFLRSNSLLPNPTETLATRASSSWSWLVYLIMVIIGWKRKVKRYQWLPFGQVYRFYDITKGSAAELCSGVILKSLQQQDFQQCFR